MKYLVTGVTGFIGRELVKELDGEVYGLVRWTHKKIKPENYIPVFADLRDYHAVSSIVKKLKPDVVVNLGAITPVSLSFERPFEYMETNLIGSMNLVESNLRYNHRLEKFVHASTPEVYGKQTELPIKETAKLNPMSPYAVSKAAFDLYLKYLYEAHEFPCVLSRHANTYGRKDQTHFVVESIVTQMLKGDEVYLGSKEPIRDFLYITDTVEFYKKLIKEGEPGEIYNAGWGIGYSIEEVVNVAKNVLNWRGRVYWNTIPRRPGEVPAIILDASKARSALGWSPKVPLYEGIKLVANWFKTINNGKS